jgi:hypothetical protein
MQRFITWRNFAFLLVLADLWRLRLYEHGVWYVLAFDGLALAFVSFPKEIDDLTFGHWIPESGKITAHTPAFLIAGFGLLMLLAMTAALFFTDFLR